MMVFKWIILILVIGLTLWLVIDTIVWLIKRVKQKKLEKLQKLNNQAISNEESESK